VPVRGDVKKQIGATDEEWKVIAPLIQKVTSAKRILAADVGAPVSTGGGFGKGFGGGFGGGFGPPGGGFGGGGFGGGGGKKGNGGPGGGGGGGGGGNAKGGAGGAGGGFGGGFAFGPPPVGTIVPSFVQDFLKLTEEQKKSLADLQKHVDAQLAKMLTEEQTKEMKNFGPGGGGPFRGGFGGPPGGGPGGPGGGPGGGPMGGPPGGSGGFGGPGGFGGGSDFVGKARTDLKAVLDDPAHSAGEVHAKVQAVRDAVERARRQLKSAQDELLEVVTADQAVILLSLGYVDATDTK
jgi:hypothetical protein